MEHSQVGLVEMVSSAVEVVMVTAETQMVSVAKD
jgi:hypothetical protein